MSAILSILGMVASAVGVASNYVNQEPLYLMVFAALFGVNFCIFVLNLSD